MTVEEFCNMLNEHEMAVQQNRFRAGDLYAEVENLYKEAAVQRTIMRNRLVALCAKYGKKEVEDMYKVVHTDILYGVPGAQNAKIS